MKKLPFKHFIFYHQFKDDLPPEEEQFFQFERKSDSFSDQNRHYGDGDHVDDVDDVGEDESLHEFLELVARDKQRFIGVSFEEIIYEQSEEFHNGKESHTQKEEFSKRRISFLEKESSSPKSDKFGRSDHDPSKSKDSESPEAPKKPWWEVVVEFFKALGPLIIAALKGNG